MFTRISSDTQLTDLHNAALEMKARKLDVVEPSRHFFFTDAARLTSKPAEGVLFGNSMFPAELTEWAMNQLYGRLGKAYELEGKTLGTLKSSHMEALRQLDPALFATVMNAAFDRLPENECLNVRTIDGDKVRAVLSDEYLTIDNDTIIGWLDEILKTDGTPHRIGHYSFVSVDNMTVDVMFKDTHTGADNHNDHFERGIRIRNGEIGNWKGGAYAVVRRGWCDNSIAVDKQGFCFEFRHAGKKTFESKKLLLKAAMLEILPVTVQVIEKQLAAEEAALPNFSEVLGGMAIKHGWTEEVKTAVAAGTEGRYTVAGLVNGITFAAHAAHASNPEAQVEMEFLGGKVLFDDRQSLVKEAVHIFNSREARKEYAAR